MSEQEKVSRCKICGEPMPPGEEMFYYHGYSGPCPKPPLPVVMSGVALISEERQRQTTGEGFTASHDDEHVMSEMGCAAIAYARLSVMLVNRIAPEAAKKAASDSHPITWSTDRWKPSDDPVRNLVKAGALIAAEIDRLQRLKAKTS